MSRDLGRFTGLYQVSETLRFELRPEGKTIENLEKSGLLDQDNSRAEAYPTVKRFLDEQYKLLLERGFSSINEKLSAIYKDGKKKNEYVTSDCRIDWELLNNNTKDFLAISSKDRKKELDPRKKVRELLVQVLEEDEEYPELTKPTPDKFLKNVLKEKDNGNELALDLFDNVKKLYSDENISAIEKFQKFACYFIGFQENRKNIFSPDEQQTAAANRAVNENFAKFCTAVETFKYIKEQYPDIVADAEKELSSILAGKKLADIYSYDAYTAYISQKGITFYNNIAGGYVPASGEKLRGLNEFINLSKQKDPERRKDHKFGFIPALYKQILSDRESISFIPDAYKSDKNVQDAILTFVEKELGGYENPIISDKPVNVPYELEKLLTSITEDDDLYVNSDALSTISKSITGNWDNMEAAVSRYAEENFTTKKDKEHWCKKDYYSFKELQALKLEKSDDDGNVYRVSVVSFWRNAAAKDIYSELKNGREKLLALLKKTNDVPLRERADDVETIKGYLDALQDLLHLAKPLYHPENNEGDQAFFSVFNPLYEQLDLIVPLYNSVRNYLTKKLDAEKKVKLMFGNASCAGGWSDEEAKSSVILKDGKYYYLGIVSPDSRKIFKEIPLSDTKDVLGKMEYYQIDAGKTLPCLIDADGKTERHTKGLDVLRKKYLPPDIYRIGETKSYRKDSKDLKDYIDYYLARIKAYKPECDFSTLKDTSKYESWKEFIDDVDNAAYSISFSDVPKDYINKLVNEGKLYLFKIYCKDFAEGAHGRKNKATMYWESIFDEDNLKNVVFKLNGGAELFKRNAVIKKPVIHRKGGKIVNRIDKDGKPIPEDVYQEIYRFANGMSDKLSDRAKTYNDKVTIKTTKFDIVKDKRYTEDKYLFHVPIVINFNASSSGLNDAVKEYLKNNPDVNIIGIDRGERNLIYVSVINQKGEILYQKSLNVISRRSYDGKEREFDYHAKLDQREGERQEARKSWKEIGGIKDFKAGYLSNVIHELACLMVKYNAIIILEDLNFGFKRGRFCVEKQVYQNFEKALITKLNYLIFKDRDKNSEGGVMHGYQFTKPFESFKMLGKQSGFLFYVPAAYTSKIDPVTGFASLFRFGDYATNGEKYDFLKKFNSICYDADKDAFVFDFDYSKFNVNKKMAQDNWKVHSAKKRLIYRPNEKKIETVYPTQEIKDAVAREGKTLCNGFDLKHLIEESGKDAKIVRDVFFAFKNTMQMRNSNRETNEDYIESPVLDKNGNFFRSGKGNGLPEDADANGAYNIAMKGLYLLRNCINTDKKLEVSNEDWFRFIQNQEYKN